MGSHYAKLSRRFKPCNTNICPRISHSCTTVYNKAFDKILTVCCIGEFNEDLNTNTESDNYNNDKPVVKTPGVESTTKETITITIKSDDGFKNDESSLGKSKARKSISREESNSFEYVADVDEVADSVDVVNTDDDIAYHTDEGYVVFD